MSDSVTGSGIRGLVNGTMPKWFSVILLSLVGGFMSLGIAVGAWAYVNMHGRVEANRDHIETVNSAVEVSEKEQEYLSRDLTRVLKIVEEIRDNQHTH